MYLNKNVRSVPETFYDVFFMVFPNLLSDLINNMLNKKKKDGRWSVARPAWRALRTLIHLISSKFTTRHFPSAEWMTVVESDILLSRVFDQASIAILDSAVRHNFSPASVIR
jgi:hypothetical protein